MNSRDAWKRIRYVSRINNDNDFSSSNVSTSTLNDYFSSVFQTSDVSVFSEHSLEPLPTQPLVVTDVEINIYLRKLKKGCGGPHGVLFGCIKIIHMLCRLSLPIFSTTFSRLDNFLLHSSLLMSFRFLSALNICLRKFSSYSNVTRFVEGYGEDCGV